MQLKPLVDALGDLQVLQELDRRVVRIRLGPDPEADIMRLAAELE